SDGCTLVAAGARRWRLAGRQAPNAHRPVCRLHSLEGSRRAFSADFIRTLADDFRLNGRQAIEKVRKTQPAAYMKICALLVPREMQIEHSSMIKQMSDEQIEEAIAAIQAMLDARAAKVIEGEAEVVPSLPAPGSGGTKMPKA